MAAHRHHHDLLHKLRFMVINPISARPMASGASSRSASRHQRPAVRPRDRTPRLSTKSRNSPGSSRRRGSSSSGSGRRTARCGDV